MVDNLERFQPNFGHYLYRAEIVAFVSTRVSRGTNHRGFRTMLPPPTFFQKSYLISLRTCQATFSSWNLTRLWGTVTEGGFALSSPCVVLQI